DDPVSFIRAAERWPYGGLQGIVRRVLVPTLRGCAGQGERYAAMRKPFSRDPYSLRERLM
ncbi:hypothetical protein NL514_29195, partial [Klebsiella pneumoniae]|nr:hypothetical protein [Klebsiella pneumoniae]